MSSPAFESSMRPPAPVYLVGKGVILETLRRKDVYVLLILSLLFVAGIFVISLVGIENAATSTFLLNLGMSLAYFFAHLLTLLSAARQIPAELENRTLYPILAKPLSRGQYYLGKWLAVWLSGVVTLVVLFLLGWLPVPRMETYSSLLLAQTFVLYVCSLALTASVAMFLSLVMPRGSSMILLALLLFAGGKIIGWIHDSSQHLPLSRVIHWGIAYIPDFSLLNLTTRYTDGIDPLSLPQFCGLILYGSIFTAFFLALGTLLFRKRSL